MARNTFQRSQFDDFEDWEEQEHSKHDRFHGDQDGQQRKSRALSSSSLGMIQSIQQRNKSKLNQKGIGHSKQRKSDPFKDDSGS